MSLQEKYHQTRQAFETLCSPLSPEDYVPQLVEYASPPKWHLAHTTWFFEEMILKYHLPGYEVFDPEFGFLFNSYYNVIGDRLARVARGSITRPDTSRVYEYRAYVDKHMADLFRTELPDAVTALITLGINHEQQHQELFLTDLKYTLGHNPLFPPYDTSVNLLNDTNTRSGYTELPEGLHDIGYQGDGFHFDNEKGVHRVYLQAAEISNALVTNGEYIEFMEAGGYERFEFWLDDAWHWLQKRRITSPLYWQRIDGQWHQYTLAGMKPVDSDALLCHVSFYEASAYAAFRGLRLPTEFEWEVASPHLDWGKRWEWTNSAYLPYPGFRISEGAVGEYNGKFMVNQMVLRGASVASPAGHSRHTYRNFFHPHFQWQFSGIRLARDHD